MERRFVRLGLAEQPTTRPAHAQGKQWGLPPRAGEVFGFVLIPWVLIVTITDLYLENAKLKQNMTQYMTKC